jgi:nucleoside-diphosphate-sugar epimerase
MSQTVVIAGAAGPLGRRVAALAAADDTVGRVLALGPGVLTAELPPSIEVRSMRLDDPEIKGYLAEADVLVHLGSGGGVGPDGLPSSGSSSTDLADTRALLDAAAAVGVRHVVTLSSAMVYGAWSNNPVPLTEEAPLRPDPGFAYASAKAEGERLVFEWRAAQSGPAAKVAVLRPAVAVSGESSEWLTTSPWSAAALRASGTDRPSQFLHLDDLASAIDHARREVLDGPFNVAPDGWMPADVLRDLAGPVGRLHLPAGVSGRLATLRADMGTSGPPEGWAYTRHAWVVANDRLRATGWQPRHRSEEAYVEADPGGPLATMSPRRRQELSLLAVAGIGVAALGGAAWAIRRARHRH